jgi:acyl dehydratase
MEQTLPEWSALPELTSLKVGPHLREPSFDAMVVPEEMPAVRYVASDAAIKAYCYTVDCQDPWYFRAGEPFGQRIAPSAMVLKELMWVYMTRYDRARVRGLHQHEDFTFHAPIPAGAELILTGRNFEKFTKRGKGYFRHQSEARDRSGRLLVSQTNTEIIDMSRPGVPDDPDTRKARRLTAAWNPAAPVSVSLAGGVAAGMRLQEGTISVDRAQAAVFSGMGDEFVNIHTSRAVALEMGFADAVVQGLMNVCCLSECLTRWAGPAWLSSATMAATFLRPMLAGQHAAIRTTIVQSGARGIELETSFVNAAGETQAVALSTLKAP